MKIVIYRNDGPPIETDAQRIRVMCGRDHFEMREQLAHGRDGSSLVVRLEEHDSRLTLDLAVFPAGANSVRLKGGLR